MNNFRRSKVSISESKKEQKGGINTLAPSAGATAAEATVVTNIVRVLIVFILSLLLNVLFQAMGSFQELIIQYGE